jgi:hypothetical protein
LIIAVAALAGCSTTSNNANMPGANTNTGYTANSQTNAKPAMPANVTNVSPPTGNSAPANRNSNGYAPNSNANMKRVPPANTK